MSIHNLSKKESSITAFVIAMVILYCHFTLPKFDFPNNEVAWDVLSYYLYLPLTFIHGDIGINNPDYIQHIFDQYHFSPAFYQAVQAPNGNWVMIYTMGMALLYLPFFLIGHVWATLGGYPTDGFSYPYQFCVSSGMMVYIIIGILFLRKLLLQLFNERVTSITLVILLLGTNYFREAVDYNMGPHAVLFAFYCLLIYYTIKWHNTPKWKYVIPIGIAIGFLTLIRPTDAICIFIPLLWNIKNKKSFRDKLLLIKEKYGHVFLLITVIFLIGLPQLIYWKYQTGSFFYNSYWNQNSFDLSESHFSKVFFSIRKGWFVYSPLIVLCFIGFFFLRKDAVKNARFSLFIFIGLNIFILTHVPVWFNAGSFGQRFMVQSYAILAIPLGALVDYIYNKRLSLKVGFATICLLLISLNLFQTWQFERWIIPGDGMTWQYYKYSFFKTSYLTKEESYMLELQRSYDPKEKFNDKNIHYKKQFLAYHNMDKREGPQDTSVISHSRFLSGGHSFRLSENVNFSPGIDIPFNQITQKDHAWIRFSFWFYATSSLKEDRADVVILTNHRDKPYQYVTYPLEIIDYKLNRWTKMTVDYLTPLLQAEEDKISAYVWYRGKKELFLDDVFVEAFVTK